MISKYLLSSKTVLILLAAFVLFLGNMKFQQIKQQRAIEKEKQSLLSQQQELSRSNQELSDSLSYLTSDDFKQRVARQQLNMKKDGEVVYNFSEIQKQSGEQNKTGNTSAVNPVKWWNYFFNNK